MAGAHPPPVRSTIAPGPILLVALLAAGLPTGYAVRCVCMRPILCGRIGGPFGPNDPITLCLRRHGTPLGAYGAAHRMACAAFTR